MTADERSVRARQAFEKVVFEGDASQLPRAELGLDGLEADLALARGRLEHARYLAGGAGQSQEMQWLERAAALYEKLGDTCALAETLLLMGIFHQVIDEDDVSASPLLGRARDLAIGAGDTLTASYALKNLGLANLRQGFVDVAREQLEESVRLSRAAGFLPGLAANLVGLAFVAEVQGCYDDRSSALDEAEAVARMSGATGVVGAVDEVRVLWGVRGLSKEKSTPSG